MSSGGGALAPDLPQYGQAGHLAHCMQPWPGMPEFLVPALGIAGLLVGATLYYVMIRRPGHDPHRQRADASDLDASQAGALDRLRRFDGERERHRPAR